jgi:hypothetical protein
MADAEYLEILKDYVERLEVDGHQVHWPYRDTDQTASGFDICLQNKMAILAADEVHVSYNSASQGTHFDLGMAFSVGKVIKVIHNETYGPGKSFARMIDEWQASD